MHIVAICEAEAAALLAATRDIADHIKAALAATQPQSEDSQEEESESSAGTSRIDAVRAFFEEHHRRKANAAAAANDAAVDDRSFDPGKLAACVDTVDRPAGCTRKVNRHNSTE